MAGDFNLFCDSKLDVQGGNSTLKNKSLAKIIEFTGTKELRRLWRVRNTNSKWFNFTQKYSSGFIQCRLDYILSSNTLQEFVAMSKILTLITSDYFRRKKYNYRYNTLEI